MEIKQYPLTWPIGKPRTPAGYRKRALFGKVLDTRKQLLTTEQAVKRIWNEIERFAPVRKHYRIDPDTVIISSNIRMQPYYNTKIADQSTAKEDTGVALYFTLDNVAYCLSCDKWDRVADNMAAIAAHLAALRDIERWGVGELHDIFKGFKALPEPKKRDWLEVLELSQNPTMTEAKKKYDQLVKKHHPDRGGSHDYFVEIQNAWKIAKQKLV